MDTVRRAAQKLYTGLTYLAHTEIPAMNVDQLKTLLQPITASVAGADVDESLAAELNRRFPAHGETFTAIERACHEAIAEGWMCAQGSQGRRFGRVIEPDASTGGLSVDVVALTNIVGPHHRHPRGEICMVMPVDGSARFDGKPRGWCVYEPDSAHRPTVTDGSALVLYMLPEGQIEFTSP